MIWRPEIKISCQLVATKASSLKELLQAMALITLAGGLLQLVNYHTEECHKRPIKQTEQYIQMTSPSSDPDLSTMQSLQSVNMPTHPPLGRVTNHLVVLKTQPCVEFSNQSMDLHTYPCGS